MKQSFPILLLLCLALLVIVPVHADRVAPYSGANTNYTQRVGNDFMESYVNVPYTMEDVGYPETLFYALFFTGVAFTLFGFWLGRDPEHIASYTLMGTGVVAGGVFLICALMAPLVCTHTLQTIVVPTTGENGSIALNATNTVYQVESVTFLFSAWIGYALFGAAALGGILILLGFLSMMRTNKEKSIEQSVNQDGEPNYRATGKKFE